MKTFYSIIYSSVSPQSHERINLGLLLFQEAGKAIVKFSTEKLSLIKQILPDDSFKLLKIQLKAFESHHDFNTGSELNFKQINPDFIQYLSNYSNNLISVTPPKNIEIEVNDKVFKKMFEQYIYKSEIDISSVKRFSNALNEAKKNFIPKVKRRVNVDYQLKASEFDFMVFNLQVDMIGKNDVSVLTQFVDFEVGADAIKHRINDYVSIIKPFEIKEGKVGKFFIVAQEPNKELRKQHTIWKNLFDSPLVRSTIVQIVPPTELDEVQEYLEGHDVKPFKVTEKLS